MAALAILVLDADSPAGIACVQSLGRQGHRVHLAVRRRGSPAEHSRYASAVHLQPRARPVPPAVAWLHDLHSRHDFALVIPAAEAACRWLLEIAEHHPLRQRAVLPSDAALKMAFDPLAVFAVARESGLPVALAAAPPGRPLGGGIGVQALCDRGRLAWHFVDERLHEWPLAGDGTLRRAANPEPELVDMSRRLLERLRWHGAATLDWRRDASGRPRLEALHPVVSTSLPLAVAAGVDLPRGLLALARGQGLPASPPWRAGQRARHVSGDIRWCIETLRAGRGEAGRPTGLPTPAGSGWLSGVLGDESWDGWSWRDTGVAHAELRALAGESLRALFKRVTRLGALARARRRHVAVAQALSRGGPPSSVLFLCLGNLCRSPFAAAAAARSLPGIAVSSAGFLRHDGRPSPPRFVETARSLGVDLSTAQARRVSAGQVAEAGLIVCMDLDNLARMAAEFPQALERTTLLGLFDSNGPPEVRDPYAMPEPDTRVELVRMLAAIDAMGRAFDSSRHSDTP